MKYDDADADANANAIDDDDDNDLTPCLAAVQCLLCRRTRSESEVGLGLERSDDGSGME